MDLTFIRNGMRLRVYDWMCVCVCMCVRAWILVHANLHLQCTDFFSIILHIGYLKPKYISAGYLFHIEFSFIFHLNFYQIIWWIVMQ